MFKPALKPVFNKPKGLKPELNQKYEKSKDLFYDLARILDYLPTGNTEQDLKALKERVKKHKGPGAKFFDKMVDLVANAAETLGMLFTLSLPGVEPESEFEVEAKNKKRPKPLNINPNMHSSNPHRFHAPKPQPGKPKHEIEPKILPFPKRPTMGPR